MSKPDQTPEPIDEASGKRGPPPLRTHRPPVSGHPEPHPPAGASKPEAKAPAAPIANDLLQKAQKAAPAASATMGASNTAPHAPQRPEASPVGMTQPPEEPAPTRVDAKGRADHKHKPR